VVLATASFRPAARLIAEAAALHEVAVEARLEIVNLTHARAQRLDLVGMFGLDVVAQALLAAHHREEVGIARRRPRPGEAQIREGAVEGLPVQVLGLGERPVDVEDQRPQHERGPPPTDTAPARIAAIRSE
jgi:hypothetical protein